MQPIRSSTELDLLFLWFPETSRLTVQVEVAFNTEGRNTTSTVLSSWKCSSPFPRKQPSQQALCKAYNNFPRAAELSAHTPNTPCPMMDSRASQRQILSGSIQVGCGIAAPQSPNKGAEQVPWWFPGSPRLPGKSPAMRAGLTSWGGHQEERQALGLDSKAQAKAQVQGAKARVCTSVLCHGCFPQPFLTQQVLPCTSADLWHGQPNPLGRERLQQRKVSLGPEGFGENWESQEECCCREEPRGCPCWG